VKLGRRLLASGAGTDPAPAPPTFKLHGAAAALLYELGVGCCGTFKKARAEGFVNAKTITSTEESSPKRRVEREGRGSWTESRRWTRGTTETAGAARSGRSGARKGQATPAPSSRPLIQGRSNEARGGTDTRWGASRRTPPSGARPHGPLPAPPNVWQQRTSRKWPTERLQRACNRRQVQSVRNTCGAPHRQQYTVRCDPIEQQLNDAGSLCSFPGLSSCSIVTPSLPSNTSLSQCSPTRPRA